MFAGYNSWCNERLYDAASKVSDADYRADLALMRDAADAAGEIAMRHFRSDLDSWDKGGGQGPVSEADLEIDRMLRDMGYMPAGEVSGFSFTDGRRADFAAVTADDLK